MGGTYFRDIYSGVNGKWYKKSWKKFDQLVDIDQTYYCSNYYDVGVNKYGTECGTSLRFWENNEWINEMDSYGWLYGRFFQWYFRYSLGKRSLDNERQINRRKRIVNRFKGKWINMIKDVNGKFDDYSISPKIRQILLHWGYELVESDL